MFLASLFLANVVPALKTGLFLGCLVILAWGAAPLRSEPANETPASETPASETPTNETPSEDPAGPPLTQADVELFVKFLNPTAEMVPDDANDNQTTLELTDKYVQAFAAVNKTTPSHLLYICEKIPNALFYALDKTLPCPEKYIPNAAEIKLLLKNKDKILKALGPIS
ncbi:MAG: hypothetical protein LBS60_09675 [Deltaproteobacteria bacterium]|jgi:hypothetical protein|nr:hypothetical protein [Deltaproteobacteria bacterium]